ncbi:MAG: rane protein [Deltaproteobacteria bacterium]|nr:rane protein [Deltaproteobacteria bacterium]
MLNGIWLGLMLASVVYAAFVGRMDAVKMAAISGARDAVDLVIGLVGVMALFLGLMRVAQEGGLLRAVQRGLAPILRRLFPDVPIEHPAMGAMIMNLASNVLGLGNAATPFGLKAMTELQTLNRTPASASDAMVLFLAINATSVSLFPLGVIGVRASMNSASPEAIWIPTLLATTASTGTAILLCFALRRLPMFRPRSDPETPLAVGSPAASSEAEVQQTRGPDGDHASPAERRSVTRTAKLVIFATTGLLAIALIRHLIVNAPTTTPLTLARDTFGAWFLPIFMIGLLLVGLAGRVRVYEVAIEGAREALEVAVRIVPFLVLILVAIAMLRASGALDALVSAVDPVTGRLGFPAEALPMALLRPLSGSGAYGVMVDIMKTHGPDSFIGILAGALNGSTETTFYVLTLYLGAARVRDGRHALLACLGGDIAGFAVATAACHWLFG